MKEKSTEINTQEPKGIKENPGRKRIPDTVEKILSSSKNIEKRAIESEAINGASRVPTASQDIQLMLTVMREGFDNLHRTLSATSTSTASAIAEAFETFKGELEIAHEEESEQESAGTRNHESLGEHPQRSAVNNNLRTLMRNNRENPRNLKRLSIEQLPLLMKEKVRF